MADDTIVETVKKTIAELLATDIEKVTEEKSFIEDLNADSLDLTELVMSLEKKFGVVISDDQAEKFKTVQDVIHFIQNQQK